MESTYKSKRMVRKKTMEYFKKTIDKKGKKEKSKVHYLLERKPEWKPGKRPEYMNKLTKITSKHCLSSKD